MIRIQQSPNPIPTLPTLTITMDAERLKCKMTHDIMSTYVPKARKLLHLLTYINKSRAYGKNVDDEIRNYMTRLGVCLNESIKLDPIPVNIPLFALNSLYVALRHQCVSPPLDRSRSRLFDQFRSVVDRWKRIVLGLDDAETHLSGVYEDLCCLSSYISFPRHEIINSDNLITYTCPLCIIADIFSDIGWTDYVCPRPVGCDDMGSIVSKRGTDTSLPEGSCEHILSTKRTIYDRLHRDILN